MKKYISKIKWYLINKFMARDRVLNNPVIYFDLNSNCYDRYLYIFTLILKRSGYSIAFKKNFGFLSSWSTHLIIKGVVDVSFVSKRPPNTTISFSDYISDDFDYFLYHDWFSKYNDSLYLPMPMVDSMYVYELVQTLVDSSDNRNRSIKVFFAGNLDKSSYDRIELKKYFNLPNRNEILKWLQDINLKFYTPTSRDFYKIDVALMPKLVLVDRKLANLSPQDLVHFLSNSSFFLALPGVVMPNCHNIIEAMAAGVIPILNYGEYFYPKLEDNFNCLKFFDQKSLYDAINKALSLSEDEIAALRKNVIEYFKTYLSTESVIDLLNENRSGNQKICLLMAEYQSVIIKNLK